MKEIFQHQKGFLLFQNALLLFFACAGICFGQTSWEWRNPLPQGNDLKFVTYINSKFVAVGAFGSIITSLNGTAWANAPSGTNKHLSSVAHGHSQFVAVGDTGKILTSPDGITWSSKSSGTTNHLWSVTYGNGLFVAVGSSGTILTSADGMTWTNQSSGTSNSLLSVTYGNGQFVVVGAALNWAAILTSTDGTAWTDKSLGTINPLYSVTYDNGLFVAVGSSGTIITSSDGAIWSRKSSGTSNSLESVVYGNGQFVVAGSFGTILTSSNGTTWSSRSSGTTNHLESVTFGNNQFIAVGIYGMILSSTDGIIWSSKSTGIICYHESITYGNSQFIAVGRYGKILTSTDGIIWTNKFSGTTNTIFYVTYGDSQFIAVGSSGTIVSSSDGITWTSKSSGTTNDLRSVTYGDSQFIAVGSSGTIVSSSDGITWTSKSSGTTSSFLSVAYGNGLFVVAGWNVYSGSVIYTSPDGTNWSLKYTPTILQYLRSVTYGNNQFVAVGDLGRILVSLDGTIWKQKLPPTANTLRSVTFSYSQFLAVGDLGTILASVDGTLWISKFPGATQPLNSVTYGSSQFVVVGSSGTILTSNEDVPAVLNPPALLSPANGATGTAISPALSWSKSSGVTNYHLQVSAAIDFSSILQQDSTLTDTTKILSALSNNITYYWRVRAKNAGGVSGWSDSWSFTTIISPPPAPTLSSPSNGAIGQSITPTLIWRTSATASTYHVQVSMANDFSSILLQDSTLTDTSKVLSTLTNGITYYWRVRAKNSGSVGGGVGGWSSAWSFTTIIAGPSSPTLSSPSNGATGISITPTLNWNTVTGASTYHVQVSTTNDFTSILQQDSTLTDTTKTLSALSYNTPCYWRVRTKNAGGVSAWPTVWSFTTVKQTAVAINQGWNMISLNIHPADSSAPAIFGSIRGLVLVKNNAGQNYWPAYGINTIGSIRTGEGYKVYSDSTDTIRALGTPIDVATTPIQLSVGWNMIAYLPQSDMAIATALAGVVSQITIVKNNAGLVYWPDYGINTIGNMVVGQGYKIHMKSAAALTYPSGGAPVPVPAKSSANANDLSYSRMPIHYLYKRNTGNNATVLAKRVMINNASAADSSEIGAFDEKGNLVGSGAVIKGAAAFSVWGDDPQRVEKDGCAAGEKITFKLWTGTKEYPLEFQSSSGPGYAEDGISVGVLSVPQRMFITRFALRSANANPFRKQITIMFDVPAIDGRDVQDVEIDMYGVNGSLVHRLARGKYAAGHYSVSWNGGSDRSPGSNVYIVRMKAEGFDSKIRLFRVK